MLIKSYIMSKLIEREKIRFKHLGLDPKPNKANELVYIVNFF